MRSIFVNLPVNNLPNSIEFVKQLGFSIDPQMTSETNACVIIEENIFVMLVTKPKFQEYAKKEIVDSSKMMESVIALSVDSKAEVDDLFQKAIKAGGKKALETKDYKFMYMRTFEILMGIYGNYFGINNNPFYNYKFLHQKSIGEKSEKIRLV